MHAILIAIGSAGDVFPFIGLARTLKLRGHRVSLVDQWLHIAEQSGLLRQRMEHWLEYRWPTAHGK